MTVPPIQGSGAGGGAFRIPTITAPISTGVPPVSGDRGAPIPPPATGTPKPSVLPEPPIALAGRLESGDVLPDATRLALALESATRNIVNGRPGQVLADLDAVWSHQLASDSPWYLRAAALQLLGRSSDAEAVLRDAIARLPRSAAMLYLLGVHAASKGQPDAARLASDHAVALHPNEPLLMLQRLALMQPDTPAFRTLLDSVRTLAPSLPAEQWLASLALLGRGVTARPTPVQSRALTRLTPRALQSIQPDELPPLPLPVSPSVENAVRFGLTLLQSPTQSARAATSTATVADPAVQYAQAMAAPPPPTPAAHGEFPVWESIVIVAGVVCVAFVPPLRVPGMLIVGATLGLLMSRPASR